MAEDYEGKKCIDGDDEDDDDDGFSRSMNIYTSSNLKSLISKDLSHVTKNS